MSRERRRRRSSKHSKASFPFPSFFIMKRGESRGRRGPT